MPGFKDRGIDLFEGQSFVKDRKQQLLEIAGVAQDLGEVLTLGSAQQCDLGVSEFKQFVGHVVPYEEKVDSISCSMRFWTTLSDKTLTQVAMS